MPRCISMTRWLTGWFDAASLRNSSFVSVNTTTPDGPRQSMFLDKMEALTQSSASLEELENGRATHGSVLIGGF